MNEGNASTPEAERIEAEAADWMSRIDRGLDESEQESYFDWLAADPRHGESLAELKEGWDAFDALDQWRPIDSKLPNPDLLKQPPSQGAPLWRRTVLYWVGAAAAVVVLGFLGIQFLGNPGEIGGRKLAEGAYAESYERHVLEDGSTIELNRGAQVSVDYSSSERRLSLLSGEAHFSVASNPNRPFVVTARDSEVIAVGTAFNVKIEPDSLEVLVTEGKVRFEPSLSSRSRVESSEVQSLEGGNARTELEAGYRAIQKRDQARFAPEVSQLTSLEVATRLAWKDAILDFDSRPLSEVVSAFNRHNHTQIVIGDETLLDMKVTVALKPDNHKGFVRLLEMMADIEAVAQNENTVILRRK